jgi:hypothetical protein
MAPRDAGWPDAPRALDTSTTPRMHARIPTDCPALGLSPTRMLTATGMITEVAPIGETMPIGPIARAR